MAADSEVDGASGFESLGRLVDAAGGLGDGAFVGEAAKAAEQARVGTMGWVLELTLLESPKSLFRALVNSAFAIPLCSSRQARL